MWVWWESLDLFSRILYCIAIPSGLILVIQTLLIIVGFGDSGEGINTSDTSGLDLDFDADAQIDTDPNINIDSDVSSSPEDFSALRLFTFQGAVAFLTVFSWTSISAYHLNISGILALFIGFLAGFAAMFGIAKLIQLTAKLASSGNISLKNALGETGRVYLPIPAGGHGKITLTVQERMIETEAISDSNIVIPSGTMVRVVDIRSGMLVVEVEKE